MNEQPVNGFVRCNGCGFDYHVSVKHDCPVPAAPTETREKRLEKALTQVLWLFPPTETLRAITPDDAMDVRSCPMSGGTPKVADVVRWRSALERKG
jgi:hypothetical protein